MFQGPALRTLLQPCQQRPSLKQAPTHRCLCCSLIFKLEKLLKELGECAAPSSYCPWKSQRGRGGSCGKVGTQGLVGSRPVCLPPPLLGTAPARLVLVLSLHPGLWRLAWGDAKGNLRLGAKAHLPIVIVTTVMTDGLPGWLLHPQRAEGDGKTLSLQHPP